MRRTAYGRVNRGQDSDDLSSSSSSPSSSPRSTSPSLDELNFNTPYSQNIITTPVPNSPKQDAEEFSRLVAESHSPLSESIVAHYASMSPTQPKTADDMRAARSILQSTIVNLQKTYDGFGPEIDHHRAQIRALEERLKLIESEKEQTAQELAKKKIELEALRQQKTPEPMRLSAAVNSPPTSNVSVDPHLPKLRYRPRSISYTELVYKTHSPMGLRRSQSYTSLILDHVDQVPSSPPLIGRSLSDSVAERERIQNEHGIDNKLPSPHSILAILRDSSTNGERKQPQR